MKLASRGLLVEAGRAAQFMDGMSFGLDSLDLSDRKTPVDNHDWGMSARKANLQGSRPMLKDNPRIARFVSGMPERVFLKFLSAAHLFLLARHKEPETVRLVRLVRKERTCLLTAYECFTLHSLATVFSRLPGELAEVGCFQGGSTKMICEAKGDKILHVFDTFEGLPKASSPDHGVHDEKQYSCSLDSVRTYLKDYPNLRFYKGRFPETAGPINDCRFSFVHCDVDLYESTLACLQFFYPRLMPGGVLLSHDYSVLAGVKTAFQEFCADKPEKPIELPSTQCFIIKA
jgi:O-methyltransferase